MVAGVDTKFLLLVLVISSLTLLASAATLSRGKPWHIIEELNHQGPYLGLITAIQTEENAFFASGAFESDPNHPFVELSGRLFRVGKNYSNNVIYVRCGEGMVNAAAVTQQMLDLFDIIGIVHFGIAGSANDSMSVGDVTIPRQFIDTGLWDSLKPNGTLSNSDFAHLDFGNYDVPKGQGMNLLGRIGFSSEEFYSKYGKPNIAQPLVWVNVTRQWLEIATILEGMQLDQCVNSSYCLGDDPKLVIGLRGSTADIFVDNAAYRKFLFQTSQVSSVDMESFAVVMTSLSNGFPVIVVRGVSDLAGERGNSSTHTFGSLAASNAVKVVLQLLKLLFPMQNTAF